MQLPAKVSRKQPIYASHMNAILERLNKEQPLPSNSGGLKSKKRVSQTALAVGESDLDLPAYSLVAMEKMAVKVNAKIDDVLGNRAVKIKQVATGEASISYVGTGNTYTWADDFSKLGILQDNMTGGKPQEIITSGISICRLTRASTDNDADFDNRFKFAVPNAYIGGGGAAKSLNALIAAPFGPFEILWEETAESLTAEHFAIVKFMVDVDQAKRLVFADVADIPNDAATQIPPSHGVYSLGVLAAPSIRAPQEDDLPAGAVLFVPTAIKKSHFGFAYSAFDAPVVVKVSGYYGDYFCGTEALSFELSHDRIGFYTALQLDGGRFAVRPFDSQQKTYHAIFESSNITMTTPLPPSGTPSNYDREDYTYVFPDILFSGEEVEVPRGDYICVSRILRNIDFTLNMGGYFMYSADLLLKGVESEVISALRIGEFAHNLSYAEAFNPLITNPSFHNCITSTPITKKTEGHVAALAIADDSIMYGVRITFFVTRFISFPTRVSATPHGFALLIPYGDRSSIDGLVLDM